MSVFKSSLSTCFTCVCSIFLCFVLSLNALDLSASNYIPERRKDQFPSVPAYLVVPLPYSYPGIGEGAFLLGNFSNLLNTTTDILAMYVVGDAGGHILQVDEFPLIEEHLYLKLYYQDINRAVVNNYEKRGMEGTGKNDYTLLDISLSLNKTAQMDLVFFNRRLNFSFSYTESEFEIQAVRDNNGELIADLEEPFNGKEFNQHVGMSIDLTDDYLNPRSGLRFQLDYQNHPARQKQDPDYYVLDYKMLLYIPLLESDTLVLNYFQSDAHVRKEGNTNPDDIREELSFGCETGESDCLQTEQEVVDVFINQRKHGTATDLGGKERLRSYPEGRFEGGHSAFIGAEYRWNFKHEAKPFNYLFWKDVRTGLQVAFFAEMATISETSGKIWDERRFSYGTGFRLVAGSGSVYRADIAFGDEGSELTVFFFYPWE